MAYAPGGASALGIRLDLGGLRVQGLGFSYKSYGKEGHSCKPGSEQAILYPSALKPGRSDVRKHDRARRKHNN